jgi:hypothetical protein
VKTCKYCEKENKAKKSEFCSRNCQRKALKEGLVEKRADFEKRLQKRKETNLKNHGVEWPQKLDLTKQKMKDTNLEKYGHECTVHSETFFDVVRESWGGNSPRKMPGVSEKIKKTNLERYGFENYGATPQAIAARKKPEVQARRFETLKKNGGLKCSKIELDCRNNLEVLFGETISQVLINGWWIDMYVSSLDVYVQFDGDFWHGLDRNLEDIKTSTRAIDKVIYRKFVRDREQDEWFCSNEKKMIRIIESAYRQAENKAQYLKGLFDAFEFSRHSNSKKEDLDD